MKTAAIPYRVADFLKQHPPFEFFETADLVALSSRGRVKFHEAEEFVCWQGAPHGPHIFVIQQGSVSLWDETAEPAALRDVLGAGDCVGLERFNGATVSQFSARTDCEVVIYALEAEALGILLERYPHAAQFVAAYRAVTAGYRAGDGRPLPHESRAGDLAASHAPEACPASAPIREAAWRLESSGAPALPLTEGGVLAAFLTPADVLRWVAAGAGDAGAPAISIASEDAVALAPETPASECLLALARSRAGVAALTAGGSRRAAVQGMVTASNLAAAFGDHPLAILQELAAARSVAHLGVLHRRARAWVQDHLAPAAMEWLASFCALVNKRVLERALHLTDGLRPGAVWCFSGSAGRQELLTAAAPALAVIGEAGDGVEAVLAESGFLAPGKPEAAPLEEWKRRFNGWIHDPILTQVYYARPWFDLRAVAGATEGWAELEAHISREVAAEPMFLHVLANDCLASLPPLTFFRDLVIEESGERTETFRLESSALGPLADVARVFGLAAGPKLGEPSAERFRRAARAMPAHAPVLEEAAETLRLLLYHQARAGLRQGSDGAELPLALLSRHDRQALKGGFRSLHRLLEFVAEGAWLEAL